MRVKLIFDSDELIYLPNSYNKIIQGFLYSHASEEFIKKVHDGGVNYENRYYKMFTFSRILCRKFEKIESGFNFYPPFTLIFSSILDDFVKDVIEGILKDKNLRLGQNENLRLIKLSSEQYLDFKNNIKIEMLSPMTIYSTFEIEGGKKHTHYYNPVEKEFSNQINNNAVRKFEAYYDKKYSGKGIEIKPINLDEKKNKNIIMYHGGAIVGWDGIYKLKGDSELIKITYDTGLGSKNSQGFGCWEKI